MVLGPLPKLIQPTRTINVLGQIPPVSDEPGPDYVAEDYTTYTEVDPSSWMTKTATVVTFNMPGKNVNCYLYKDKGAAYFDGSFSARMDMRITSGVHDWGTGHPFVVANVLNNVYGIEAADQSALVVEVLDGSAGWNWIMVLREHYGGSVYSSSSYSFAQNTYYYLEFERDESVGTHGTIYLRIYSDSARTTLLDTLSVTLHAKVDFRYLYWMNNYNNGDATSVLNGTFENLSLLMPA